MCILACRPVSTVSNKLFFYSEIESGICVYVGDNENLGGVTPDGHTFPSHALL